MGVFPWIKMAAEKLNSEEMRSKSSNWTLACDMQLRLRLEATKEKLHLKAQNLSDSINDLNAKTNVISAKLGKKIMNFFSTFNLTIFSRKCNESTFAFVQYSIC